MSSGGESGDSACQERALKAEGIIYSNRIVVVWDPAGSIFDDSLFKVGQE